MTEWLSSGSCDELAAQLRIAGAAAGAAIAIAGAAGANPYVVALGVATGFNLYLQGEVIATFYCENNGGDN